jgi:hypothetical protein
LQIDFDQMRINNIKMKQANYDQTFDSIQLSSCEVVATMNHHQYPLHFTRLDVHRRELMNLTRPQIPVDVINM